ncbi:MAG: hypothetical protein JNK50_15975 [Bacteroidia bacterium]|nr:hypothetical protein [Bacteroidia bacterium]
MKRITYFLTLVALMGGLAAQTEKDYSLAKVGKQVDGVFIFVGATPVNPYDVIDIWDVYWNPDDPDKSYKEALTRVRKKYNNVDGIIFEDGNHKKAQLIKFIGREITGGGFKGGDKVSYKEGGKPRYAEIFQLDNTKQKASVKYLNEYGEDKLDNISYEKLTPVNNETFNKYKEQQLEEIKKHQFAIGEKVSWTEGSKLKYGEVVSLNNEKHDAKVKFLDIYGDVKTDNFDYLKLEKADINKYNEFVTSFNIEIEKYKFLVGEQVSWIESKSLKVGEVVGLNNSNHKASIKYLNIYGEEKTTDVGYLEIEKISKDKYLSEKENFSKEIQKYKFTIGEKVNWSKGGMLKKTEIIQCEVISLDDLEHKALVKYKNKDNVEKQEKVPYLELSKTQ